MTKVLIPLTLSHGPCKRLLAECMYKVTTFLYAIHGRLQVNAPWAKTNAAELRIRLDVDLRYIAHCFTRNIVHITLKSQVPKGCLQETEHDPISERTHTAQHVTTEHHFELIYSLYLTSDSLRLEVLGRMSQTGVHAYSRTCSLMASHGEAWPND